MTNTQFVLGVAGPSGSGKSTFAERLLQRLPEGCAQHLEHDAYYRDLSAEPMAVRSRMNFDEPGALDNALLAEHLGMLRQGQPVEVPEYDFRTHSRSGSRSMEPCSIVMVTGILLLAIPALCEQLDLAVYVDTDLDVCLMRRVQRDAERGRSPESVLRQYEETVRPMCKAHVLPSRAAADFVVPGEGDVSRPLAALADVLRARAK